MTLCPIAIAAGCKKCPAVSFCPLKAVIGDFKEDGKNADEPHGEGKQGKGGSAQGPNGAR